MRWKALEFIGKLDSNERETFGFTSYKCPPTVEQLANFESDLFLLVKNIEYRPARSTFQHKVKEDIRSIKNCKELLVPADKSTDIYKIDKSDYNKYLQENITKTYKKSNKQKIYMRI